jgi:hypothetical protein
MKSSRFRWHACGVASFTLATACLPGDTRPAPAELVITATASEFTSSGIPSASTADGFAIAFERVLVALGDEEIEDSPPECNEYSSPAYTRLFDFAAAHAPEEVGIAFGLGSCGLGFGVKAPDEFTKLGAGASADDRDSMRVPGSDRVARDGGVSVWIVGSGVLGDRREHFSWPFRAHFRYQRCGATVDGADAGPGGLTLRGGARVNAGIQIEAEELFQDHADPENPGQHFAAYAAADADGDGEITLDELWSVPLDTVRQAGLYVPKPGDPGDGSEFSCRNNRGDAYTVTTLGDYTYCVLIPRIAHFEAGNCALAFGGDSSTGP